MVRLFRPSLLSLLVSVTFSGCLSLSFGGKNATPTPGDCLDALRIANLEARVQTLEQRLAPSLPPPGAVVDADTPAN